MQSKQSPEWFWHYDDCVPKVREIDHEQRQRRQGGKQELVSPAQVQHIVSKSQENHAADGQKCTDQLHKLSKNTTKMVSRIFEIQRQVLNGGGECYTDLVMREALTLVPHKAAEERHWNEAEEDDEEDRPTDDTLGLRAAKRYTHTQQGKPNKRATTDYIIAGDSHLLFGCFVEIHSVQSG